eukprot:9716816-Lingulodinium_polyedra.AAC.1
MVFLPGASHGGLVCGASEARGAARPHGARGARGPAPGLGPRLLSQFGPLRVDGADVPAEGAAGLAVVGPRGASWPT